MKFMPLLLINAALVVGGLVIYDQIRSDEPTATYESGGMDGVRLADLEARLRLLERPLPGLSSGGEEAMAQRIEAVVERRLAGLKPVTRRAPYASGAPGSPADAAPTAETPLIADGAPASPGELARFRRMMEATEEQRRTEREMEMLSGLLERIEVSLTPPQKEQLLAVSRDYRAKVGEVWRNAFRGGSDQAERDQAREVARVGMETLKQEFTVTITNFLPSADASKIVANFEQFGRGFNMAQQTAVGAPAGGPGAAGGFRGRGGAR